MQFFARIALLFCVIVVLASSCASVPGAKSADDCLVIIKSSVECDPKAPKDVQKGRTYQFEFTSDYKPVQVGADYTLVVVREPAVSIKSISTWASGGYSGGSAEYKANVPLPYKPGCAVVADYVFVKKTEETGTAHYITYTSFRKITDSERAELADRIKTDSAFSSWQAKTP
jgi:hypothetical protein